MRDQLDRRGFFHVAGACGAGLLLGGRGKPGRADGQPSAAASTENEAAEFVTQQSADRWRIADVELEKNGESFRGPSLLPPKQWDILPVSQRQEVRFKCTTTGETTVDLLLPMPRSLGEVKRQTSEFRIVVQPSIRRAPPLTTTVRVLKTAVPFRNAFLSIRFQVEDGQSYAVESLLTSLLSVPGETRDDQSAQRLLPRYNAARMQATNNVRYNASINGRVRLDGQRFAAGDCGIRAAALKELTQGHCEIAAGWCTKHPSTNGLHVWCLGPGNVVLDADGIFVNQRDFTAGMVGDRYLFPKGGPFADLPDYLAPNNAAFSGLGADVVQTTTLRYSTPKFGERQNELRSFSAAAIPLDVTAAHEAFAAERQTINAAGGGGEQLLAKIPVDRR